jgi:phage terminase large subunit-like protein
VTAAVSTLAPRARRRMVEPPPPHPVTQYALDVVAGRIVAGILIRKACERHLRDLADGPARGLTFDAAAADRAISFCSLLRHYKGEWGPRPGHPLGDRIELGPWQKFLVGAAFGWKRADGSRRFRSVYVEIAKKNGKTLIAAVIGILLAFFDDEPGAEVYAVATKRDQAKLVWNDALQMIKRNPDLAKRLETLALTITDLKTASFFRPLGRDSDTDQGINPHGAIVDELHVLDDRDTIDNIETATSARRQPMVWKITTAGVKRQSVWAEERADAVAVVEGRATDDSMLVLIYTLDEGDDPFDEAVWPKANPNLGVSVNVETLREQAEVAKRSPGKLAAFLRFRMDIPTAVSTRAIDIEMWDRWIDPAGLEHRQDAFEPGPPPAAGCYGGLDLASVRDLTALLLWFAATDIDPETGEVTTLEGMYDVLCWFWCPAEGVDERSKRDGVPYADWVRDGFLIATPGNVTDYAFIQAKIEELAELFSIGEIGFDRWNATQLATQLMQGGASMVAVPQTHAGLGPAWREWDKLIIEGKVRHGAHPVLRWMAGNMELETDAAGNQKPSKRLSSERIDGMVAGDMALGRWMANGAAPAVWTAA